MYAGRVACCPVVSQGEYAVGTNRQTGMRTNARPLLLFTLSVMDVKVWAVRRRRYGCVIDLRCATHCAE